MFRTFFQIQTLLIGLSIGFSLMAQSVLAQNKRVLMGQIPLNAKYQKAEQNASPQLKQRLAALRAEGVAKKWTFQVGVTSVSERKVSEVTGAVPPKSLAKPAQTPSASANNAPPIAKLGNVNASAFDLRAYNLVTPVRDQGNCGSCWAFCTVASLETAHIFRNQASANTLDLSEQQILNCSGAGGCGGGQPHKVWDYVKTQSCVQESSNPYQASDIACPALAATNYKIENWGWVGADPGATTIAEIKNALIQYSTVSAYVYVNPSWFSYTGGVINDDTRTPWPDGGWHCVQIVGWDDNLNAWLIKNSWGKYQDERRPGWGEAGSGFGWVDYNVLDIGKWSTWVVANAKPTATMTLLGLKNGKLKSTSLLDNMLDNSSKVVGKGDFNGDGTQDFIVYSADNGIKIFSYVNSTWQVLVNKPSGTWFGGWNFNAGMSPVGGIGDFNGDGKDDIVMRSYWGISILTLDGAGSMTTLMQQPNGTDFEGWRWWGDHVDYMTMHAVGDFNGDHKADLLVTSSWGVGILTLKGNSMTALMSKQNGTRFGGWLFSSQQNTIEGAGDFNGDGKTDIVIRSGWGLGILTFNAGSLDQLMGQPIGSRFGGWLWNADADIRAVNDFNGDGRADLLVSSLWGIGVVTLQGTTMSQLMGAPNGTRFGGWLLGTDNNKIIGTGDFDGNGKKDVVIRSAWGIGVLTMNAANNNFDCLDLQPYGTVLGSWSIKESDKIPIFGNFDRADRQDELLIQR